MSEEAEIIDSALKIIFRCFPVEYKNDEKITVPQHAEKSEICICLLEMHIIIAYRSLKSNRLISEVVFEKQNALAIAEGIDKLLSENNPHESPVEFEQGRDKILITFSSSWPHNLPSPLERINLYNRRGYELDGLRACDMWFSAPPESAYRLAEELKKLS